MLWLERFAASRAIAYGLVTEVVDEGTALDGALEGASGMSQLPPLAVRAIKQASEVAAESSRAAGLLIEQLAYAALAQTNDADEAALAFVEKRDPGYGSMRVGRITADTPGIGTPVDRDHRPGHVAGGI